MKKLLALFVVFNLCTGYSLAMSDEANYNIKAIRSVKNAKTSAIRKEISQHRKNIEQIVLIIGTLIYVGILVLERHWIIYTIYKYLIYIIYVLCYIIISEIYFYIIRKNANKREFLLPKVIKHFQNIYKTIIVYIFVHKFSLT